MAEAEAPGPKCQGWLDAPPFIAITAAGQHGACASFWGLRYNGQVWASTSEPDGWKQWLKNDWSGLGQPQGITQIAATVQDTLLHFWAINNKTELWSVWQLPGGK